MKKKKVRDRKHGMHNTHRAPETKPSEPQTPVTSEERRSHHREDGVLSKIEDITYKVLRQHEPKRS